MELAESAKKYIDENRNVYCKICGERVYPYDKFECTKRGHKFVFVHKDCIEKR